MLVLSKYSFRRVQQLFIFVIEYRSISFWDIEFYIDNNIGLTKVDRGVVLFLYIKISDTKRQIFIVS